MSREAYSDDILKAFLLLFAALYVFIVFRYALSDVMLNRGTKFPANQKMEIKCNVLRREENENSHKFMVAALTLIHFEKNIFLFYDFISSVLKPQGSQ